MPESTPTSVGVQALISRIRDEGIQAGRSEADDLLRKARAEAARITSEARAEATQMKSRAQSEIATESEAAIASLRNAARDGMLDLKEQVRHAFQDFVARLVSKPLKKEEFIRDVVLVLAGDAADKYIKGKGARVFLSPELFKGTMEAAAFDEALKGRVQGLFGEVLREGIELIPASDVHAGARVRLVDEDLQIDLTDEAITSLMLSRLLPRYRRIIEEE